MSEPTVEEVREALDALPDAWPMGSNSPMKRIVAAARLWVDAAEPDIEAAAGKFYDLDSALATDLTGWARKQWAAKEAVAAAFGDHTLIRRADR